MNAVSWFDGLATPDKWRGNLQARAPRITVWILALAIGVQAAIIVTNFAGTSPTPSLSTMAQAQAQVPVPQTAKRANVAAIANSHIFGAAAPPAQPQPDEANAPQTSMPLVLTGIIADDDPRTGFAILGESAAAAKVYAVGDNVPGGARLHSVYEDRVLLDRGGRLESLSLPRNLMAGMSSAAPPPPPPMPTAEPLVDRMKRLISEEPGVISDVMRPQPVFAQGKQRGYRVYPGRNRQAFMRLGLRPGDLVVSINGTPLDDPARGQEIFRTIGSSSEAHVTVMRNGRQQDLTLNMSQVAADAESLIGGEGSSAPSEQQPEQQPQMPPQPDTGGND